MQAMKKPYLIQRGKIRKPIQDHRNQRLGVAVEFDYMGSAEFEFGALPASHRAIGSQIDEYQTTFVTDIIKGEAGLRIWHNFSDRDLTEYIMYLKCIRDNDPRVRLKEYTGFERGASEYASRNDFWWDIQNHCMFSFNKEFMSQISIYEKESLKYMNEAKEMRTLAESRASNSDVKAEVDTVTQPVVQEGSDLTHVNRLVKAKALISLPENFVRDAFAARSTGARVSFHATDATRFNMEGAVIHACGPFNGDVHKSAKKNVTMDYLKEAALQYHTSNMVPYGIPVVTDNRQALQDVNNICAHEEIMAVFDLAIQNATTEANDR